MVQVMIGGALGAMMRYLLSVAIPWKKDSFPYATFTINVVGSAALGVFVAILASNQSAYLFIAIGIAGAFTTFSTFSIETMELIRHRKTNTAILYVSSTLSGIFVAFAFGFWVASLIGA